MSQAIALRPRLAAACGSQQRRAAVAATTATSGSSQRRALRRGTVQQQRHAAKGGTYRVEWEAVVRLHRRLRPDRRVPRRRVGHLLEPAARTLVSYNHVAGAPGNELVPDLATDVPEPSEDGLTYTFTSEGRHQVRAAGEPRDHVEGRRSTRSSGSPPRRSVGQYGFYYTAIEGFTEFANGKAKTISGIETPDDKTIIFHLTKPTGDFLYRLAMPAAAPIPEEVRSASRKAGDYGRYVISSGPYMIAGRDKLDARAARPSSRSRASTRQSHVSSSATRTTTRRPTARGARTSRRVRVHVNTNADDIFDKVEARRARRRVVEPRRRRRSAQYATNPARSRCTSNSGDRTWYLTMNLTQPPFDDIHVRKAVNSSWTRQRSSKAWGGPTPGASRRTSSAGHPARRPAEGLRARTASAGNVAKAKAEMKQSKYDTEQGRRLRRGGVQERPARSPETARSTRA